jgi:Tol biopolymer transport system component
MPRWSPVADVIAYGAHKASEPQQYAIIIWLIDPDGSNPRPASNPTDAYLPEIDWSPDGRWLIATSYDDGVLHLIDTQTGLTLPLAFTKSLRQPSWRSANFLSTPPSR